MCKYFVINSFCCRYFFVLPKILFSRLQAVPLKVVNLRATATSRYQNLPVAPVSPFVSSYQELVAREHEHMVERDTGELKYVVAMEEMYKALLLRLEVRGMWLLKFTKSH